jgi:FolB domain-containing protein
MDRIIITNLRIQAILGVYEWERRRPQEIVINLSAHTDVRKAAGSDAIQDCLDYSDLAKEIRALVDRARRFTVEALAEDIAVLCLGKTGVRKVTVRVEKPKAIIGADTVGVEIERPWAGDD